VAGAAAATGLAGCSGARSTSTATTTDSPTDTATPAAEATETPTPTSTPTDGATPAAETVVAIPDDRVPENLAFGPDGALFFGITAGELRRLAPGRTDATGLSLADTERVATLPGAIGVEVGPDGTGYVAVASGDDRAGVWSVADGEASPLAGIGGFPNDVLYDADRDRLLVTESQGGVVYAVGTDGERTTWLDDDRLSTESFGANGLTRGPDGEVYVAVTRAAGGIGRLLRVPVADGAARADEATVHAEGEALFGADGITARGAAVHVAANSQNRIVRVAPDGSVATVADAADGLVFPSDVLFGPDGDLFVCNFANDSPADAGILRVRLDG
jgi:sugar lactone lactonase YvrE